MSNKFYGCFSELKSIVCGTVASPLGKWYICHDFLMTALSLVSFVAESENLFYRPNFLARLNNLWRNVSILVMTALSLVSFLDESEKFSIGLIT